MNTGNTASDFDEPAGHRFFSAACFNRTWEMIDKPNRTEADDEQMLLRAYSSLWHWTQRDDCTPRNLSIGYWLLSRVHVLLKQAESARHYGELCLKHSADEPPFFIGYAQEALARAAKAAGNKVEFERYLSEARKLAVEVTDADDRAMLEKDLESLK